MTQGILVDFTLQLLHVVALVDFAAVGNKFKDVERSTEELVVSNSIFSKLSVLTRQLDESSVGQEGRVTVQLLSDR